MGIAGYTLTDSFDKNAHFSCGTRKQDGEFFSRPNWRDRGFGKEGHTDAVDFEFTDGTCYTGSGDLWRFFEGTLGLLNLHFVTNRVNGVEFFLEFAEAFLSSGDDANAKRIWEEMVGNLDWDDQDACKLSFYVGELSRHRLECLADYLGVDFTKHTTADDLRAGVLEAAQTQGLLFC